MNNLVLRVIKIDIRNFLLLLAVIIGVTLLPSCIYDHYDYEEEPKTPHIPASGLIVMRVSTVSANQTTSTSEKVTEKIRSLRFIMLSDNYVVVNKHIYVDNMTDGSDDASKFSYTYTFRFNDDEHISANTRFYFIANEECVGSLKFSSDYTVPQEWKDKDLTWILSSEKFEATNSLPSANAPATGGGAGDLEKFLNAIYFRPEYNIVSNDDSDDNSGVIYLPYSVYYSLEDLNKVVNKKGDVVGIDDKMYLVPVAAKFEFHFENYRTNAVDVKKLTVSSFNTHNYMLARVKSDDCRKTLPGETASLYWPDWLAKISELSWDNVGSGANFDFNEKYGWIAKYDIPTADVYEKSFLNINDSQNNGYWKVPAPQLVDGDSQDKLEPGVLDIGPYYMPESNYLFPIIVKDDKDKDVVTTTPTGQRYVLSMVLHDSSQSTSSNDLTFDYNPIENLGALFRNTHVVINVVMREGESGVYAEIEPWTVRKAVGWVGDYKK
ncbi:MAG: hypothetical protein J1F10_03000 [Muribaculaceae bacterium]|nr:hypothetical protein [Muribaculaceae bacterium]